MPDAARSALFRNSGLSSAHRKAPTASYRDFIMSEVRYNSLTRAFPKRAEKLFTEAEKVAKENYEHLEKLSKGEIGE